MPTLEGQDSSRPRPAMVIRALPVALTFVLLAGVVPAVAQRIDILTGEPVRPSTAHPRPEPDIVNAPHAPRQQTGRSGDTPPLEVYVTPQLGAGTPGASGVAGPLYRGPTPRSRSR